MRLKISHETIYRYDAPLSRSIQILRLTPRSNPRQRILDWRLDLPATAQEQEDAYGNRTHLLTLEGSHQEIRIGVEGLADTLDGDAFPPGDEERFPPQVFLQETPLTAVDARLSEFAAGFRDAISADPHLGLWALIEQIRSTVRYTRGTTHPGTTAAEAFSLGSGVCQDHSHLFIAACRVLKIPARYVSGYYYSGPDADPQNAMHAWAEAWVEPSGWFGLDVSNGVKAGGDHLRLAVGRDYLDACPVRGVRFGGEKEMMEVRLQVITAQQ